jgi:O-methyltransferase domain
MVPPPVQILESLFGVLDYGALVALGKLGVADALQGRRAIGDLAAHLGVEPDRLDRLTRYAATRGWLRIDRHGRIGPNRVTPFLRTDHPGGWSAWVDFAGGHDVLEAVWFLGDPAQSDPDTFKVANGATFFDWMGEHPQRHAVFDRAMSAGGRMHGLALAKTLDWSNTARVCDVGGGDGALLSVLVTRQPHLAGVVLDLPEVVARAEAAEGVQLIGGDAFASVPTDCQTYLYVNVLHDWGDDDAVRLLSRAAIDAPSGARIIVVETQRTIRPIDDLGISIDILMLAVAPKGRERTAEQFAEIARRAGLRLDRQVALPSADFAFIFTRAGRP